jgi:hypothetical protein
MLLVLLLPEHQACLSHLLLVVLVEVSLAQVLNSLVQIRMQPLLLRDKEDRHSGVELTRIHTTRTIGVVRLLSFWIWLICYILTTYLGYYGQQAPGQQGGADSQMQGP